MKALKLFALSYLVKTILVAIAWLFIPDLPQRAASVAHHAWGRVQASWGGEASAAVLPPAAAK